VKKILKLGLALLFAIPLFGMETGKGGQVTKTIKIPLVLLSHLDRESALCLVAVANNEKIIDGEIVSDELILNCFDLDLALNLQAGSILITITVNDKRIITITLPNLKRSQHYEFAKTIILGEETLANSCLFSLASKEHFVEAYDFLCIYFTHADELQEEAIDLINTVETKESSIPQIRKDIAALPKECALLPPIKNPDGASFLTGDKICINCTGTSNQQLFNAIINRDLKALHESLKVITEEMVSLICGRLDCYGDDLVAICKPVRKFSLQKSPYRSCVLF
jgi:hypothetical protein